MLQSTEWLISLELVCLKFFMVSICFLKTCQESNFIRGKILLLNIKSWYQILSAPEPEDSNSRSIQGLGVCRQNEGMEECKFTSAYEMLIFLEIWACLLGENGLGQMATPGKNVSMICFSCIITSLKPTVQAVSVQERDRNHPDLSPGTSPNRLEQVHSE